MSVIAWDGKTIAADRQATHNGLKQPFTKIVLVNEGVAVPTVLAIDGRLEMGMLLMRWWRDGRDAAKWPAAQRSDSWAQLIVATANQCFEYEQEPIETPVAGRFWAWGSGRQIALGALAHGAKAVEAVEAVEIACRYADSCGLGIDVFELGVG